MEFFTPYQLTSSCFLSGVVLTLGMCVLEGAADFGPFLRGLPPPGLQGKRLYRIFGFTGCFAENVALMKQYILRANTKGMYGNRSREFTS